MLSSLIDRAEISGPISDTQAGGFSMDYNSFYLVSINFTIHPVKGVGNSRGECDGGEGDPRGGLLIRSSKFQRIMYLGWVQFSLADLQKLYEDIHINTYSIFEAKGGTLTW